MNKEFLYTLLDSMSVSGHEIPLQKKVIEEIIPKVIEEEEAAEVAEATDAE